MPGESGGGYQARGATRGVPKVRCEQVVDLAEHVTCLDQADQALGFRHRLDAQFSPQHFLQSLIAPDGLRLPADPQQKQHQVAVDALIERVHSCHTPRLQQCTLIVSARYAEPDEVILYSGTQFVQMGAFRQDPWSIHSLKKGAAVVQHAVRYRDFLVRTGGVTFLMLHHAIRRPEQVMGIGANLIARFQYKIIAKSEQLVGPNIAIQLQQPTQPPSCVVERRASFLVERERWDVFNDIVREEQKRLREMRVECTGPWPPYDFVRMQFGA